MAYRYTCPHCAGLLNPGHKVIFVVDRPPLRELFLLSPTPGDYTIVHRSDLPLEHGRRYLFRCPLCHAELSSELDDDLVEILCEDERGTRYRVNFSRVHGQRATFFRSKGEIQCFGEDVSAYEGVNFFGAGDPGA